MQLRLTFSHKFSDKLGKLVMPELYGIERDDLTEENTERRLRYALWRMVASLLRDRLGELVDLLEKQASAFYSPRADEPSMYDDDEVRREWCGRAVAMARKLDDHPLLISGSQYTRSISPLGEVLGRAPGQAPPRGLIAQGRRSLLTKLQSLPAHGHGFRVLVIDTAAKKVLRQFTTLDECAREAGVCLCEDISAERFPLKDLEAVYIVEPTPANLLKIQSDFVRDEMYYKAHILFTSDDLPKRQKWTLKKNLGESLGKLPDGSPSIDYLHLDFLTTEGRGQGECRDGALPLSGSFFNLDMPKAKDQMKAAVDGRGYDPVRSEETFHEVEMDTVQTRKKVAERLAHVCAQLGDLRPAIRWQQAVEEHRDLMTRFERDMESSSDYRKARTHTARTCKEIAEELADVLGRYAKDKREATFAKQRRAWHAQSVRESSGAAVGGGDGSTCVLIVDRTVDPLAPLLHDGSYEAMYDELLDMNFKKDKRKFGDEWRDVVNGSARFNRWRGMQLSQAASVIERESEQFESSCAQRGSSAEQLQEVQARRKVSEEQKEFALHKKMVKLLNTRYTNRKLDEAYRFEVAMAAGSGGPSSALDIEVLAQTVKELPWLEDKARLTLSYLITHRETAWNDPFISDLLKAIEINDDNLRLMMANLSGADKKEYGYGPSSGRDASDERYTPTVCLLAEDLQGHRLKENLFPYVGSSRPKGVKSRVIRERRKGEPLRDALADPPGSATPRRRSKQSQSSGVSSSVRRSASNAHTHSSAGGDQPLPYSRVIIFVIGGVSKAEIHAVEKLDKFFGSRCEVYVGGTEVLDAKRVLSGLKASAAPANARGRPSRDANGSIREMKHNQLGQLADGSADRDGDGGGVATLGYPSGSDDDWDEPEGTRREPRKPSRSIRGMLKLTHRSGGADSVMSALQEYSLTEPPNRLGIRELCDAVGVRHWDTPFGEKGRGEESGEEGLRACFRRLADPPEHGSPMRSKVHIGKLAEDEEIREAMTVAAARDLLRAHDGVSGPCSRRPKCRRLSALRVLQDRDGRLTFHELEACLLKGSTVVKQGAGGQKSEVVTRVRSAATLLAHTLASSLSKPLTL